MKTAQVKRHIDMGPRSLPSPYIEIRESSPSGKYSSAWWCDPVLLPKCIGEFATLAEELNYIRKATS